MNEEYVIFNYSKAEANQKLANIRIILNRYNPNKEQDLEKLRQSLRDITMEL